MTTASAHRSVRLCAPLILICAAALLLPWGRSALGAETDESPCILTDEQRAAYEADGTLDARIAYQESLRNDRPSEGLISQAVERERAAQGIGAYAVPSNWSSGMASVGAAHVLGLRITFPDHQFEENDTLDALQSIIGPKTQNAAAPAGTSPFPYESLSAYYYRASYGKLSLTGEAFDYTAKYERDYYTNNPESLVAEALAALDESENLSRFDANKDGKLDAVYVHFAGPDTGWGSVWWSNESTASDPTLYEDGSVRLWNMVLLAENSSNSWAARTIIHETGHVLGLPDYYSARSQTGQGSDRSGILTFDMMMQNMGDHNGYSKWLVGWLPEEKITRIVANEDGISVTRNGEVLEHHDAVDGDTPSVDATLGAYAGDDASETGGIVVVSNQDTGMFSSLYLIEYDRYAGNQSVRYLDAALTEHELPSGFRVFRVRGELTDDGSDYANSNLYGTVHSQLIELVDPDMDKTHTTGGIDYAPSAVGEDAYGCMLFEGSAITPQGYPSTNFFENASIGFTGLTIAAKDTGGETGTISVSYSDDSKPEISGELALAPTFESFSNTSVLTLRASTPILKATEEMQQAQLVIDGSTYMLPFTTVKGDTVSTECLLDPEALSPSSRCELVYPAGMFVLGKTGDETLLSPEVRIPLQADSSMAKIASAGVYANTAYESTTPSVSGVLSCPDGNLRFVQAGGDKLTVHTIDRNNPGYLSSSTSIPVSEGGMDEVVKTLPLENNHMFVVARSKGYPSTTGLWIDLEAKAVTSKINLSGMDFWAFGARGSEIVVASRHYGDNPVGGTTLSLLSQNEDGSVSAKHAWTSSAEFIATQNHLLFSRISREGYAVETESIAAFSFDDLAQCIASVGTDSFESPYPEDLRPEEYADTVFHINMQRVLLSAAESSDGYAMVFSDILQDEESSSGSELLVSFGNDATKRAEAQLPLDNSSNSGVSIGRNGCIAVRSSISIGTAQGAQGLAKTAFYDSETLEAKQSLIAATTSIGSWTSDGSWIDIGRSITNTMNGAGSPLEDESNPMEGPLIHYVLTEPIDTPKTDPEHPQDPSTPPSVDEGQSQGTDPDASDAKSDEAAKRGSLEKQFAQTGDIGASLAILAVIAGGLALHAARTALRTVRK